MAKQFVFLRIVRMNGIDLNQFRFDYDLTWMAFFLSAEGRIYCRYGGRGPESAEGRISKEGLLHAMKEVLRIHKEPDDPAPARPLPPRRVDALPPISDRLKIRPDSCVHCHMVNEGLNLQARGQQPLNKDLRQDSFYAFPLPESIGIKPDLTRGNRVLEVVNGSAADKCGLQKGDILRTVQGQPVVTAFDIQYGLNEVGADNKLSLVVERNGEKLSFNLVLPSGWKRWDVTWRKSLHNAQPLVGWTGEDLTVEEKAARKIGGDGLAFKVTYVYPSSPVARAGLQVGDVIVGVGGKRALPYQHLRGYLPLAHDPGDRIEVRYLRGDKEQTLFFDWR